MVFVPVLSTGIPTIIILKTRQFILLQLLKLYIYFCLSSPIWVDLSSLFTIAKIKQIPEIV